MKIETGGKWKELDKDGVEENKIEKMLKDIEEFKKVQEDLEA